MEDALRVNQHRHDRDTDQRVLILVLMEDVLRVGATLTPGVMTRWS